MAFFSIWSIMLYVLVPVGLLLLLLLTCPPTDYRSQVRDHDDSTITAVPRWSRVRKITHTIVERVLFGRLGFLPADLISFLLVGLSIMLIAQGVRVYDDMSKTHNPALMLDVQLQSQGQSWRRQRNVYLTALALLIWYFLAVAHSLQVVLLSRDETIHKLKTASAAAVVAAAVLSHAVPARAADISSIANERNQRIAAEASGSSIELQEAKKGK